MGVTTWCRATSSAETFGVLWWVGLAWGGDGGVSLALLAEGAALELAGAGLGSPVWFREGWTQLVSRCHIYQV